MSFRERIDSLRVKHAALDEQLQDEAQRPSLSNEYLNRLKREKLRIKDEIQRLATG
ncbi:MAG: YdcH family protein [Inquilinaceae bacterium]